MAQTLKPHPAAELFPMMSDGDLAALAEDINSNGQREPIILHEGLILDGRNRYEACRKLGIEVETMDWAGRGSPQTFVISMNLHRRHLNESQRGMIAAKLANVARGEVSGSQQKTDRQICRPEAAKLLNVGEGTVGAAKIVLREGTTEEIAAVERGDLAVGTLARDIRQGKSPAARKAKREAPLSQSGRNPERIQRAQMEADLWAHVDEALAALTSLPLPSDVAAVVGKNPQRSRAVESRLARSLQWLKDFDNVWRNRGQAAAAN